jgi:hypothetical protein
MYTLYTPNGLHPTRGHTQAAKCRSRRRKPREGLFAGRPAMTGHRPRSGRLGCNLLAMEGLLAALAASLLETFLTTVGEENTRATLSMTLLDASVDEDPGEDPLSPVHSGHGWVSG